MKNSRPFRSQAWTGSPAFVVPLPCNGLASPSGELSVGYPGSSESVQEAPPLVEGWKPAQVLPLPSTVQYSFAPEVMIRGARGLMAAVGSFSWRRLVPQVAIASPVVGTRPFALTYGRSTETG